MTNTDNTGKKQGGRFQKGMSGNPSGRPRGSLNKATLAAQALLEGEAEALTRKAIELAIEGDTTALRLALERIIPARKDSPVNLDLPPVHKAQDVIAAMDRIIQAVGNGELTPGEASSLASIIEHQRRSIETQTLEQKINHLETIIKSR